MGMTVVCQACGARRTLPSSLYDSRVRGKMVHIPCKNCGQAILVDGTVPPPPGTEPDARAAAGHPQAADPTNGRELGRVLRRRHRRTRA